MSRLTAAALAAAIGAPLFVLACTSQNTATSAVPVTVEARDIKPTPLLPVGPSPSASRASRSRRIAAAPMDADGYTAAEWASSRAARAVAQCESGNDGSARSHTGKYRGKWQMDADFWRTYGGLRYASSPEFATVAEQDAVAFRGWLDRGWQPWTCARIVGVA